jgi:hypothetical protein
MRAKIAFAAVILMAGTLFSAAAAPMPDQWTRNTTRGLTVWADVEFRGADHTFINDMPDISSTGMARIISSLRPGQGETWQVCTEPNYRGRCRIVSGSVSNMQEIGWNDVVMSVRRLTGTGSGTSTTRPGTNPADNLPPATGLELYAGTNFSGRRMVLRQSTTDFRSFNFNDAPLSARVPANTVWEVCVHIDYEQCRQISGDLPDLNEVGISRMISSARPVTGNEIARNRGWYQGRGQQKQEQRQGAPTTTPRLVVFEGPNFTGRRVTIEDARTSLLGTAASIQVVGGRWQLCDRADFLGNCVMVNGDVPNISELSLRGRVASLRPMVR